MLMESKELLESIEEHGIILAKTTEDFESVPKGTKLWFGIKINEGEISSYDNDTKDRNKEFGYNFDYEWLWEYYPGKFIVGESVEEKPKDKFKVGDMVRLVKNEDMTAKIGATAKVIGYDNGYGYRYLKVKWIRNELSGTQDNGGYNEEDFELVKDLIVHCPTQELYDKVQKKMLETTEWVNGDKKYINYWEIYGEETCLCIRKNDYKMGYSRKEFSRNIFPPTPIISAEEYLGTPNPVLIGKDLVFVGKDLAIEEERIRREEVKKRQKAVEDYFNTQLNKLKNKTMLQKLTNTLKKVLPSDIQKQYRAGLRDGDLALTGKGNFELLELLADKFSKELTDRAIEIIKEEEK